ncbi:hypothetical protein BD779DRAFT_1477077 [Infundibulicybe gibba]|nr:hypothetical protein BD779DRAFT_1477077 [Infundibulicybe gibba]
MAEKKMAKEEGTASDVPPSFSLQTLLAALANLQAATTNAQTGEFISPDITRYISNPILECEVCAARRSAERGGGGQAVPNSTPVSTSAPPAAPPPAASSPATPSPMPSFTSTAVSYAAPLSTPIPTPTFVPCGSAPPAPPAGGTPVTPPTAPQAPPATGTPVECCTARNFAWVLADARAGCLQTPIGLELDSSEAAGAPLGHQRNPESNHKGLDLAPLSRVATERHQVSDLKQD